MLAVKMIPDYTLMSGRKVVLVLDAKQPREDILSREAVQQVYSYAIHPEIKSQYFCLCNGKRLIVFDVDSNDPILDLTYENFETSWAEIRRHLLPAMLKDPTLRRFAPDFGCALARLGLGEGAIVTLLPASFNLVARLDETMMSASANVDFVDKPHCVSFDFDRRFLPSILSCLPTDLAEAFSTALDRAPFQAAAELAIELELQTILGPEIHTEAETFRPLVVQKAILSRLSPLPSANGASDIPSHVFQLRRALEFLK